MLAINPEQFGGFSFDQLKQAMADHREVFASFNVQFKANKEFIWAEWVAKKSPLKVHVFTLHNNEEGLNKGIFKILRILEEHKVVDGFQVENEDAETYAYESFEILDLASALSAYLEAIKLEPDHQWYINIIGPDDIEEPSYVSGVAEFDLDNAPI